MTAVASRAREPIAGNNPAGEDLTFDAEFEAINAEIQRLEAVDGTRPDWRMVEAQADRLLAERTKDHRLVVWAGAAKIQLRAWEGLADAVGLYLDVITFWDTLYPPARRLRARANLHEWFVQHAVLVLEDRPVRRTDEGALVATQATLEEVDAVLAAKLAEMHPGSQRLRTLLKRKLAELAAENAAAKAPAVRSLSLDDDAAPPSVRDPDQDYGEGDPPAVEEILLDEGLVARASFAHDAHGDPDSLLARGLASLLASAQVLRARDPANPQAWRIRRVVAQLKLEEPSAFESPDPALRDRLRTAYAHGDYRTVIDEAEQAIVDRPGWLDAHRFVAESLLRAGAAWAGARQVALEETMALVTRAPALARRRFADGTPTADAATHEWLEAERRRMLGATALVGAEEQENERRLKEVHALAAEGKIGEAVALATALAHRAADLRGRFRGTLLAGTMALNAGSPLVARPLLDSLAELVERHQLEVWEPGLCASLYGSLLSCLRVLRDPSAPEDAREHDLFDRLCRLDPAAAMRLG